MSFKSVLQIDGLEMNVLDCQYSFTQQTDHNGKPAARPSGGTIKLLVASDGDTSLFDWMISNTQTKSGSITFFHRDALSKLKELHFKDACCVEYNEHFNATDEHPIKIQLVLSARELQSGSTTYKQPWPAG